MGHPDYSESSVSSVEIVVSSGEHYRRLGVSLKPTKGLSLSLSLIMHADVGKDDYKLLASHSMEMCEDLMNVRCWKRSPQLAWFGS